MKYILLIALSLLVSFAVQAHTIWIETIGDKLIVRFAEPGNELEKSPGYLDSLTLPVVCKAAEKSPVAVAVEKKSDGFALSAASTDVVCAESAFTVRGGRKPIFYARWQPDGGKVATPALTLDIVPTGNAGEARLYFRGQPLADTDATLRFPDDTEKALKSDKEGFLHFEAKAAGQYLLTVPHYRESLAGFQAGVAYKETSHNAALTWRQ